MWEDIQAAVPLGFLLSFMIGPVFFVLLETSAIKGFRAAIVFDFGVILADGLFLVIAYFSSFQLLENLSNQPGLYVFGGVILLVYGITTIFKKPPKQVDTSIKVKKSDYLGLFVKGFLLNFINIGVLVFWLGIIIVVGPSLNNDPNRIIVFFSTMVGAYFVTDIFKILLAKQLKKKLTINRIYLIKKGIGIILIICGIVLIVKGFLPKDRFNIENGIERIEKL
ncbi:LysE family transporter [Zobellia galactanivorans]|uniref:LysE-type amino acid translocator n=1 Tax=Zobellia galactanivorans (strain DSM 12802 / CCUG 47099 / CIP 106680 / NCIMB 13871 / Dsij) TaxID=63186 RepID=G0LB26_ZOBGA|nr:MULTISPECIES: LysE family transporter [Zobellia]MBU3026721.1 LysE family transporter [Zobellia galactanivorans]MDO6809131.1 LysE family transporter [Zobellia galactanivorans]OWW26783.1 lysine transporter LysE [Zobellia sp. OII3]CAZ95755.1 LysE-type amino acid translocator [Zobellia galactanivorans]